MTACRVQYQMYFFILCSFYLLAVVVFHNQLQMETINKKHQQDGILSRYLQSARDISDRDNVRPEIENVWSPSVNLSRLEDETANGCFLSSRTKRFTYKVVEEPLMYVYSAYFDPRLEKRMVRIMAILLRFKRTRFHAVCKFDEGKVIQNGTLYEMCENHNRRFGGYIVSCEVPDKSEDPCKITLVVFDNYEDNRLIGEVTLPVIAIEPEKAKYNYGVCVPPLFGELKKESLIEFIEVYKLLGASHFIFYDYNIQSNDSKKVLQFYEQQGSVTIIPWQLPENIKEKEIWYHGQLIAHNDCLYRSMSLLKKVSVQDIDEFIVPHSTDKTWDKTFGHLLVDDVVGLSFHSAFYEPQQSEKPLLLVTMGSILRTAFFSKVRTKVMIRPSKVFEIGIHHVSRPLEEGHKVETVDVGLAYLHHYRKCVGNYGMKCTQFVEDRTMHQYYHDLKRNFDRVLNYFS